MERAGKIITGAGLVVVLIGIIIWLWGDKLRFLGRLPGDIRLGKENVRIYIPVTTMILISALLSILLWIFRKLQ